ncbi:MAG: hypothetical protein RMI89_08035 [Gloeomargarita sp. SKYBB_i_bin120]|nr:hypothetical protein [Gloeomargarita sp. SKYB120]MDW8178471.1 hypothetical protein [Gloeomargarita sp. SKYBB_i_bin120]
MPTPDSELMTPETEPVPVEPASSWLDRWPLLVVGTALVSGLVGFGAVVLMLRIPSFPKCNRLFLPTASVASRLYCAQEAARSKDVAGLERAIALLADLPPNHPQRAEIDRFLNTWAMDLLALANEQAQAGNLEAALEITQKIPPGTAAAQLAQEELRKWQMGWTEVTRIYEEAEAALRKGDWRTAMAQASLLPTINESYAQTERYQALIGKILRTRQEATLLEQAEQLAQRGQVASLLEAMGKTKQIPKDSYLYEQAQAKYQRWARDILDVVAVRHLRARDLAGALAAARSVPADANLQEEVADFIVLAEAEAQTWSDTVAGYQAAIAKAKTLDASRPLYNQAQIQIETWQQTIVALNLLNQARQIAQARTVAAWNQAIALARQIPSNNPLWNRAQADIAAWTNQIQIVEDSPILARAEGWAAAGTIAGLSSAIAEAQQIRPQRALYARAQERVREWRVRLETLQDQPLLDAARQAADRGDWQTAINEARRITAGRALYSQAQAQIKQWQGRLQLQDAEKQAALNTPQGWLRAIQLALPLRNQADIRPQVEQLLNQASSKLLEQARQQESQNPAEALNLARQIPPGTTAHAAAQELIRKLAPPAPQPSPSPTP